MTQRQLETLYAETYAQLKGEPTMTNKETITGYFVDPENGIAEPRTIEKSLDGYYSLLRCDLIDIVSRVIAGDVFDIICDDEALLKDNPTLSAIDWYGHAALCGPLFIVNGDYSRGDVCSLTEENFALLRTCILPDPVVLVGLQY